MSKQDWAVARLRRIANFHAFVLRMVAVVAATAFAFGCASDPPRQLSQWDPSDPRARVPAVGYRSTVAPYESLRPVEPAPWIQQNQQIAPQPKR